MCNFKSLGRVESEQERQGRGCRVEPMAIYHLPGRLCWLAGLVGDTFVTRRARQEKSVSSVRACGHSGECLIEKFRRNFAMLGSRMPNKHSSSSSSMSTAV